MASKPKISLGTSSNEMTIKQAIVMVQGVPVILASDLAKFYDTTTKAINQYRSRNTNKFTPDYAFQLTQTEWKSLRSQNVTTKSGRGGSRTLPWAYTEHGVAMMSMGMKSENAVRLSKVIIDTFVDYRRGTLQANPVISGANAAKHRRSLQEKIYHQMEQILDVKLPTSDGLTVRDELSVIATKSLGHIKAVLDAPTKNNEKISAEITRILAEAEKLYAETRKLNVETDTLVLQNYRTRLNFIRDLREMAQQLERDDWVELFDDGFGDAERKLLPSET